MKTKTFPIDLTKDHSRVFNCDGRFEVVIKNGQVEIIGGYCFQETIEPLKRRDLPAYIIKHGLEVFSSGEQFEKWLDSKTFFTGERKWIDFPDEEIDQALGRIEWGIPG